MVIRLLDHVTRCSTYEDGEVIYRLLANELARGQEVEISFDGVLSVPSSFVNAALVKLLERFPFEVIRDKMTITHSTRQINELIKSRFEFALRAPRPE
jgi:hypothetical protein